MPVECGATGWRRPSQSRRAIRLGGWPTSRGQYGTGWNEGAPLFSHLFARSGAWLRPGRTPRCGRCYAYGTLWRWILKLKGRGRRQTIESIRRPGPTSRQRREKWGTLGTSVDVFRIRRDVPPTQVNEEVLRVSIRERERLERGFSWGSGPRPRYHPRRGPVV
jgi:hypothetical protein